jgi:hypothetical protein
MACNQVHSLNKQRDELLLIGCLYKEITFEYLFDIVGVAVFVLDFVSKSFVDDVTDSLREEHQPLNSLQPRSNTAALSKLPDSI